MKLRSTVCFLLRYISSQYILDCVEKNEQLNLEDYRLNPAVSPRHSARLNKSRGNYAGLLGGMMQRPNFTFVPEV